MNKWKGDRLKKKILVVDDDVDNNSSFKVAFEDRYPEYEVIIAENGKKCLELLKNNQIPDAILLDIMMPEMSGWETYDRIKANGSWGNIPIIFVTAKTDEITKSGTDFLGDGYIEKPYEISDIKKNIDKVLKNDP